MVSLNVEKIKTSLSNLNPLSESTQNKIVEVAKKVGTFIQENKGTVFFASSVAFVFLATSAPLASITFANIFISGIFGACVYKGVEILTQPRGLSREGTENMNAVLGGMNLCAWYIDPSFGVATAIFNVGVKAGSLAFRHLFEIKLKT